MIVARRLVRRPHPPRVAIVARELRRFPRPRYLEIGVNTGVLFLHVRADRKVAVDPAPAIPRWKWLAHPNTALRGELVTATSDEFFAQLPAEERFDVIFVDGYHTHEQSRRDVEGALSHLNPEGVVMVHDCNPPSAGAACRDPAEAGGPWCGDVFKTIVELRATRPDLEVETLDADFGIGVIRRRPVGAQAVLELRPDEIAELTYHDLARNRTELLGLRAP